ncbi:MAG: serine/threonine protein kinase [Sandaracinaceae bacterium]|nr:serine/threonine protein kinase [Sandaracinaceae bacterium]
MDEQHDATVPDSEWIGRLVAGRFRLVQELGAGGIAVVFRAEDEELSRAVAVKILQEGGHGRAELRARFEREAKVLAALSHPNIVSLVDYGVEDGRAFLVMELLRGRTVGELLDEEDVLAPERAFHILRQVVRALRYAHGEGLLHRDLKPDNVFLQSLPDTPDHVRLLDFGFAKFVGDEGKDGPRSRRPAPCSVRRATWRPSSSRAAAWTAAPISTRSR